jgi:hypothetical protein
MTKRFFFSKTIDHRIEVAEFETLEDSSGDVRTPPGVRFTAGYGQPQVRGAELASEQFDLVPKLRFGNRHPETLFHCWVRRPPDIGRGTKPKVDGPRVRTSRAQSRMSPLHR